VTQPPTSVYVGVPQAGGKLADGAAKIAFHRLVSANAFWDDRYKEFRRPGRHAWSGAIALDSAGFVAMMSGGYRWTVDDYVEFVARTSCADAELPGLPSPWAWWSAMDYCCEAEIARDRATVISRIDRTVETLAETLEVVDYWRECEGIPGLIDPMPIVQGRTVDDYLRCADRLAEVMRQSGRDGLPGLIGVGSVCRRELSGREGLIPIVTALDATLPNGVRLHLFGVKGDAVTKLGTSLSRVKSLDSMAWDFSARMSAREERKKGAVVVNNIERRLSFLSRWYSSQLTKVKQATEPTPQLSLFGG
jgi:hypothetical protein